MPGEKQNTQPQPKPVINFEETRAYNIEKTQRESLIKAEQEYKTGATFGTHGTRNQGRVVGDVPRIDPIKEQYVQEELGWDTQDLYTRQEKNRLEDVENAIYNDQNGV